MDGCGRIAAKPAAIRRVGRHCGMAVSSRGLAAPVLLDATTGKITLRVAAPMEWPQCAMEIC
jgi:hypothetical protein